MSRHELDLFNNRLGHLPQKTPVKDSSDFFRRIGEPIGRVIEKGHFKPFGLPIGAERQAELAGARNILHVACTETPKSSILSLVDALKVPVSQGDLTDPIDGVLSAVFSNDTKILYSGDLGVKKVVITPDPKNALLQGDTSALFATEGGFLFVRQHEVVVPESDKQVPESALKGLITLVKGNPGDQAKKPAVLQDEYLVLQTPAEKPVLLSEISAN